MTGFRIGYACGPAEIIEAMMKIHQYSMLCASIISQEAAIEAINHGEPDMRAMREQYRVRRNFIVKALNGMGLPCLMPRGSFYAFPSIKPTGLSSKEFAVKLLEEEKVACVPGGAFGPTGEGFLRCCFATSLEQLQVAMERMGRFVRRL
jgi:aminotransferase